MVIHLNVIDYLVKPVSLDRFIQACGKAWELHQLKTNKKVTGKGEDENYFFINVDYSLVKVDFDDIIWVEGLKDYIKIHLKSSSKPLVTRMSMKAMEEELPAAKFIRVQKSYIVSKDHITAIRKNSLFIGAVEISIGENYKDAINSFIKKA